MDLEKVLEERAKTHGDFSNHAEVSQTLKNELYKNPHLSNEQREALEMICHKIARIIAGNPNVADHWRDIAGYAELVVKDLEK